MFWSMLTLKQNSRHILSSFCQGDEVVQDRRFSPLVPYFRIICAILALSFSEPVHDACCPMCGKYNLGSHP